MNNHNSQFRYNTQGHWYKGNTHVHSLFSDGGRNFRGLANLYTHAGYDFLFRTDHWVASDALNDAESYPLLWMDGIELDGQDQTGTLFHVVCLGAVKGINPADGFVAALESARQQRAFLILAHPYWSGNSLEDALRWGFHGVEIYNHLSRWLNGKTDSLVHWDAMLKKNPDTLGFSADDSHFQPAYPGWNGGWIMVNAEECSREAILTAIGQGNFYSSCGPEFRAIISDGESVQIVTSPVQFVRLVGPGPLGQWLETFDSQPLTQATLEIPKDWDYVYLEIEDRQGRRAWTNTLFTKNHLDVTLDFAP